MNNIDIIKTDEYLKKFIEKNNLSDEYVNAHMGTFTRAYNSRIKCRNCLGLHECKQDGTGKRLDLSYDGVLIDEIEYCNFALARLTKQKLANKYVHCDVPSDLMNVDLSNINLTDEQKPLFTVLYDIFEGKRKRGLYIAGDLGVGKTYLCIALCNSLAKNNESVAFVKVANFFNEMKSYIGANNQMIDTKISSLKKAKYLVLDDIGSESVSEFVRDDILFPILDYRLENKLTTIFTSNLNKGDLFVHYQYDRKEKANAMSAKRLIERVDILSETFVLSGNNMRRE